MKKRKSPRNRRPRGSASEEPRELEQAPRWSWQQRLSVAVGVLAVLLLLLWGTGLLARGPFFYAEYHLVLRNHRQAVHGAKWARLLNGDPARAEFLQARIQRRWNNLDAMERHLRAAERQGLPQEVARQERDLALAQSGKLEQVSDSINMWMTEPGNDVADIADAYSQGLEANDRAYEAKVVLTVWRADCPSDPKPHMQLARLAENELRDGDAEREYRLALEKNPHYPPALFAYGNLLWKRKRPEEALPLLQTCVQVDPQTKPAVDLLRAACQRLLGERQAARKILESLAEIPQKEFERVYRRLATRMEAGSVAFERGQLEFDDQEFEQATKYFRLAAKQSPDHFDAERQLALSLQRSGRTEEAEEIQQRVEQKRQELATLAPFLTRLQAKPNDAEARYQIGNIMLNNGRVERGLFYLKGALVDAPEHVPTHRRLFEFYSSHRDQHPSYAELADQHEEFLARTERQIK